MAGKREVLLTDEQWEMVEPLITKVLKQPLVNSRSYVGFGDTCPLS